VSIAVPATPSPSGGPVAITLTASNLGPTASAPPVITTTLPSGAVFYGHDGEAWSCTAAGLTVACAYTQLQFPVGAAPPLKLIWRAPPIEVAITNVTVNALIFAPSPDPQPGDNTTSAAVTVERKFLVLLPLAMQQ
jgi:hypothetical protein